MKIIIPLLLFCITCRGASLHWTNVVGAEAYRISVMLTNLPPTPLTNWIVVGRTNCTLELPTGSYWITISCLASNKVTKTPTGQVVTNYITESKHSVPVQNTVLPESNLYFMMVQSSTNLVEWNDEKSMGYQSIGVQGTNKFFRLKLIE